MSELWKTMPASDVQPGDRLRLANGQEMTATKVDSSFFGMPAMVAFIEDTPNRWFKQPMPATTEVEVLREA
jgi:hypothetical protein